MIKSVKSKTKRTDFKTPFEEIQESIIEQNLVQLCVSSILGKKIKSAYERSEFDENNNTIFSISKKNTEGPSGDENNKNKTDRRGVTPVSGWKEIPLNFQNISETFVANYIKTKPHNDTFNTNCYVLDESELEQSTKNISHSNVEKILRTVLPSHADQVTDKKSMTPVTFIMPTGLPLTTSEKSTTHWNHFIVKPTSHDTEEKNGETSQEKDLRLNKDKETKLNMTNRLLLLFQALNLTTLKAGRKKDQVVFTEIASNHPVLKNTIDITEVKEGEKIKHKIIQLNSSFETIGDKKFSFQDIRGSHSVSFSSLRVEASRINDQEATLRDTDLLSKGLASLMTYMDATLITIYVESSRNDFINRPYIIAPKKIIDMFLDLRDFGFHFQKYYEENNYRVTLIAKIFEAENNKLSKQVKRLEDIYQRLDAREEGKNKNLKNSKTINNRLNKIYEKIKEITKNIEKIKKVTEIEEHTGEIQNTKESYSKKRELEFERNHLGKGLYAKKPTKKTAIRKRVLPPVEKSALEKYKTENTVKISEMRSSLGFRVCRIDFEDFFDNEGVDFDEIAEKNNSRKPIIINFPIPYRYSI